MRLVLEADQRSGLGANLQRSPVFLLLTSEAAATSPAALEETSAAAAAAAGALAVTSPAAAAVAAVESLHLYTVLSRISITFLRHDFQVFLLH